MSNYRRNFVTGGCYFFTVNLANRKSSFLIDYIDSLREAFRYTQNRHLFTIDAIVVMPEHLHAIWTLPPGDQNYATRWRLIKTVFSRSLPGSEFISNSRKEKGERGIWQRRYWEHTIKNEADFARHVDYLHFNPVKHGYVDKVIKWPYSSFHRFVEQGVYAADWAGSPDDDLVLGER